METSNIYKGKKDEETTTMQVSYGLLRFLHKFGNRVETFEQIIWRLILTKDVTPEQKEIIKEVKKDYSSHLE